MQIEHIALNIGDPVGFADWYAEHLGMEVLRAGGPPAHGRFIRDSAGRTVLEVYHNATVTVPDYSKTDPLVLHIAFVSEDVPADRDRLAAAGATVVEPFNETEGGDQLAMLRDPWGLAIQLVRRAERLG